MSDRYIDLVLEGRAIWTQIDDFVAQWHRHDDEQPLHDYLGLSFDEYALWVEQPKALRAIIAAHKMGEPVYEILGRIDEEAVAARGLSAEDARAVRHWLEQTGRLPRN